VRAAQAAERLRLPEGTIFAALAELERQGFLARVDGPSEAYLPSRAPATIRVADLWQALGGRMGAADGDALARLLAGACEASVRAMGSTTVQDLLDAGASPAAVAAGSMAPRPAELKDSA
jgi:DNA-binding IscR family transcriptional regulator